jgi:hypothetical protein
MCEESTRRSALRQWYENGGRGRLDEASTLGKYAARG